MFKHNAVALAVSGLSVLAGCSTVALPEHSAAVARAASVEPVMTVRNSGGLDSDAMYRIGRYYQGQSRYDDAALAYRKALALDRRNVEARNALAVVYAVQGLALDAEREFKAAIAQSPGLSHLHSNLGYHYLQSGRSDAARAALREAIRLDPANERAASNLAAAGTDAGPALAAVASPAAAVPAAPTVTAAAPVAAAEPVPATVASAPLQAKPVATIAELVGSVPMAPNAQLVSLAPNVWQLRPRAQAAAILAPNPATVSAPGSKAIAPSGIAARFRLEVANGNGVAGLARRVGAYLRSLGMDSPRLTNVRPFEQRRTQIEYVQGMEDRARELGATLGTPAELALIPRIERNAQLRVVLGKDFREIEAVARMPWIRVKPLALAPAVATR